MIIATLDFETRSEADLRAVGPWAYAEHPTTEVICACFGIDGGDGVSAWLPGSPIDFLSALASDPDVAFEAHNAAFEYSVWHCVMVPRHGLPPIPIQRWRDSMAVACYYALPPALEPLCKALGLPGKDPAGERLIQRYSKLHLKTAKRDIPAEDLDAFVSYCRTDVERERQVGKLLGLLPEPEEEIFLHDFEVAARGLRIDGAGALRAKRVVEKRSRELEEKFARLTGGLQPGQRDAILGWLKGRGAELEDLQADTLKDFLEEAQGLGEDVRAVIQTRLAHAKASTKKLDAMLRQCGGDGRARFQTRYHGAATGRNTGSGFQPLNLVRNWDDVEPEQLVRDIEVGDPAWLDALYGDAMDAVARASRHWIVPDDGCRLMSGDFSSVEAVVNACLAGEEWKVQLFRDGGDPYCTFASKVVGREVFPKTHPSHTLQDKKDRQEIGKPGELAFGYQGAVGAWRKFDTSDKFTDEEVVGFTRAWRDMHPMIRDLWRGLEEAALEAVFRGGSTFGYRDLGFECVDGWLTMILPDGKRLWYYHPHVRLVMPRWHEPDVNEDCAVGTCGCEPRPQVHYWAQKEGRFRVVHTYGGKLCENAVQATSRQLLKPCELALARAGYKIVLSVYDEIVCEVPNGQGSPKEFAGIVAETIAGLRWASGWPIRMDKPWEDGRYKK